MKFSVIVVAAGTGTRFGGPKQFVEVAGKSLLEHSVEPFLSTVDQIVVVLPSNILDEAGGHFSERFSLSGVTLVAGGADRSNSVKNGLAVVQSDIEGVLVHDGARPLVSKDLIERVKSSVVQGSQVVVPVTNLSDTLYSEQGEALDRTRYRLAQTPQGFTKEALTKAHSEATSATDDGTLAINAGYAVTLVEGERINKKVTFKSDVAMVAQSMIEGES